MNLTDWEKKQLIYLLINKIQHEEELLKMTRYVVRQQVKGLLADLKKYEILLVKVKG